MTTTTAAMRSESTGKGGGGGGEADGGWKDSKIKYNRGKRSVRMFRQSGPRINETLIDISQTVPPEFQPSYIIINIYLLIAAAKTKSRG